MHTLPPSVFGQLHRRATIVHPAFCWLAGVSVVIGWHVPAIFAMGMKSAGWHAFEQASFVAAGILFWWPVLHPWPAVAKWPPWSAPLYLFLAALPCDALSAFLCLSNRVVYPYYSLEDQSCAGALMWVWVTFVYLLPAAALTFRLLSPDRRFVKEQVV
jgi:cytochrome c oxidase assembly factor CtaG